MIDNELKLNVLAFYKLSGTRDRAWAGPGENRDQWDGPACHRQVMKNKARTAALQEAGALEITWEAETMRKEMHGSRSQRTNNTELWVLLKRDRSLVRWHTPSIPVLGSQADL